MYIVLFHHAPTTIINTKFLKRVFAKQSVGSVSAPVWKIKFQKPRFPKQSVSSVSQALWVTHVVTILGLGHPAVLVAEHYNIYNFNLTASITIIPIFKKADKWQKNA